MRFRLLHAGTYRFCSLFQVPSVHSHFVLTTSPTPLIGLLSFPFLCFSHNHTHPFITRATPIPSLTHSITHTHSMGCITAKTERSPQTRFWTGANPSIDSRSSSYPSFSNHTHYFDLSFYHSLFHFILSLIPFSSSSKRWSANVTPLLLILSIPCCVWQYTRFSPTLHSSIPTHSLTPPFHSLHGMCVGYEMIWWWSERKVWGWRNRFCDGGKRLDSMTLDSRPCFILPVLCAVWLPMHMKG